MGAAQNLLMHAWALPLPLRPVFVVFAVGGAAAGPVAPGDLYITSRAGSGTWTNDPLVRREKLCSLVLALCAARSAHTAAGLPNDSNRPV